MMTPVDIALFTVLAAAVPIWLIFVSSLVSQLLARHPEKYDEMYLAEIWPRSLSESLTWRTNSRPVMALVRFLWRGEDAALHDPQISRLSTFMRWFFCAYLVLFLSLVFLFFHQGNGFLAGWNRATAQQRRESAYRLHRAERWDEALARYDQLLGESEADAELHYYRGAVYWQLGQLDRALEDFRRVIELEPTHFDAHREADRILSYQRRWDEVLEMWSAYIAKASPNAEAYFERGGANFHKGDLVAAQADAAKACQMGKAEGCLWEGRLKTHARHESSSDPTR
jgi:tetratricopeptide (TPR) repeat protein